MTNDPEARVACEVVASNRLIIIGGEVKTTTYVDVVKIAWDVVFQLGYNESDFTIISNINKQSPDINQTVDKIDSQIGAGDQGIMFGFATNETPEYMPLPIVLSHELVKRAEQLRVSGEFKDAGSDMKSQVTIDYSGKTPKIHTMLMSIQHKEHFNEEEFTNFVKNEIMFKVAEKYNLNTGFKTIINPSGKFVIGGPIGDTGLTGRKIIVDTYGGYAHHGGGAFSGKDYTKVDRSASYAARWIAKHLVAAEVANKVEIQISYGIGLVKPISISIDTFGENKYTETQIIDLINHVFDLSPNGIIKDLDLKKPIYYPTSFFGHFGRNDLDLPWERLDRLDQVKEYLAKTK